MTTMTKAIKSGYKQTEWGVIPEDWDVLPLINVATIQGGYAFSSKRFVSNGKYQVIKMSNLYDDKLDLNRSVSFLNKLTSSEQNYKLTKNDILITLTGTVGKRDYGYTYRIKGEKNLLLNQRVARIISNERVNPTYLDFQLKTNYFLDQFFDISKGGTGNQTNVGTSDIEKIVIPIPTLPEQAAIATVLSDTDVQIASLDKLIAKKRDIKQATMQQLLTGKTRLPGFSGEWEVKKLREIAEISMGRTPSRRNQTYWGRGYKWLSIADLKSKHVFETKEEITALAASDMTIIPEGTLLRLTRLKEGGSDRLPRTYFRL